DYQAGRFGPLAYDLASLLIDPYVSLSQALQQKLLDYYCQQLEQRFGLDSSLMRKSYGQLACMRNMQILGAFSFLLLQKKKAFFKQFIPTALRALDRRLQEEWAADLPGLRNMVNGLLDKKD
ncbi:MAG: nucleoside-diphosphate-sugar pyrophosphorylase, partial [Deltaproteobacteria bacterium]